MQNQDPLAELCEIRLFEKAAQAAVGFAPNLSPLYRAKGAAAIKKEAFVQALTGYLDIDEFVKMLQEDRPPPEIVARTAIEPLLDAEVRWALLMTLRGQGGAIGAEMDRYLGRHPEVSQRLPHKVTITFGDAEGRPISAVITPLEEGETDLVLRG